MKIDPKILEYKDKDATMTAVFSVKNFPQFNEELMECIDLKVKYDAALLAVEKVIVTEKLDIKGRLTFEYILKEHKDNWARLADIHPEFPAYFLTHKRFVKKREERLALAKENLSDKDSLVADLLLIKLETSENQIISLSLDPIKMMKKETERKLLLAEYIPILTDLANKFSEIDEKLEEKCPYFYRGLKNEELFKSSI